MIIQSQKTKVISEYYEPIILQCTKPKIVDISSTDYVAEEVGIDDEYNPIQMPFIIAHSSDVTLKVETWLGDIITWSFSVGPYPMPLKRIIFDAANTQTTIQISY